MSETRRNNLGRAVYDDTYGVITEEDLIKDAAEAFQLYDQEEASSSPLQANQPPNAR